MKMSICIPTYNRAKIVYQAVIDCLKNEEIEIEIIVCDNCSKDDTEAVLQKVTDKRFFYYRNRTNIGFENLVKVLTYATGDYILLLSDEDTVNWGELKEIISILETREPAILKGGANIQGRTYVKHRNGTYKAGFNAIRMFGSGDTYMSGYVFNNKTLRKVIGNKKNISIKDRFGYFYCFANLSIEMLQYGDLCFVENVITDQVRQGKTDKNAIFNKGEAYFLVDGRMQAIQERIDAMSRTKLNEEDKFIMLQYYIERGIIGGYIGVYKEMYDEDALSKMEDIFRDEFMIARSNMSREEHVSCFIEQYEKIIKHIDNCNLFGIPFHELEKKYFDTSQGYESLKEKLVPKFKEQVDLYLKDYCI